MKPRLGQKEISHQNPVQLYLELVKCRPMGRVRWKLGYENEFV